MDIDEYVASEITNDINRIETILNTNIFAPENMQHPLCRAAFTELIVCLNDLLQKAKDFDVRVAFNDDIVIMNDVKDVTDTVNRVRNAACHIPSKLHFHTNTEKQTIKISFVVLHGKAFLAQIDDIEIRSDFADDTCFMFGAFKLYLNRHIIRALEEAKQNLLPLIPSDYVI